MACFKRSGSSTVPMSVEEIKDLLINSTESYYDESVVDGAQLDKLDFDRLARLLPQTVDNGGVRSCFGVSSEKASTLIKPMVADKVLEPNSPSRKYAKYILTEQYREKVFG